MPTEKQLTAQQLRDRTSRFVCGLLYDRDPETGQIGDMKQGPILFTLDHMEFVAFPDRHNHFIVRTGIGQWALYQHYSQVPVAHYRLREGHVETEMFNRKFNHGCTDALCRQCGG